MVLRRILRQRALPDATEGVMKKDCGYCGGLVHGIVYRKFTLRFCSLAHKKAYVDRQKKEQQDARVLQHRDWMKLPHPP